jgi:hypothetical protein
MPPIGELGRVSCGSGRCKFSAMTAPDVPRQAQTPSVQSVLEDAARVRCTAQPQLRSLTKVWEGYAA